MTPSCALARAVSTGERAAIRAAAGNPPHAGEPSASGVAASCPLRPQSSGRDGRAYADPFAAILIEQPVERVEVGRRPPMSYVRSGSNPIAADRLSRQASASQLPIVDRHHALPTALVSADFEGRLEM
jgi:hypothetical protein